MPPVFHDEVACFYVSDNNVGTIRFYKYNANMEQLEPWRSSAGIDFEVLTNESSVSIEYQNFSLVRLGTNGFLFKAFG